MTRLHFGHRLTANLVFDALFTNLREVIVSSSEDEQATDEKRVKPPNLVGEAQAQIEEAMTSDGKQVNEKDP